jgi:hypothetical protein
MSVKTVLKELFVDTLKKDGKWSRTSLTMFISFAICVLVGLIDFFMHGYNTEVFFGFLSVAVGSKISDALSKKIHN